MWTSILLTILKAVVIYGANKLKDMDDGITKDVAVAVLDAVAISKSNGASIDAIDSIKQSL